jgi:hypothetical protein
MKKIGFIFGVLFWALCLWGQVQPFILDSNTVALWHFNEGSALVANDESGNHFHGVLEGGATWDLMGQFNCCVIFDGDEEKIRVADHSKLDLTTEMTIDAWVYLKPENNRSIIVSKWKSTKDTQAGQYLFGFTSGHHLYFSTASSDQVYTIYCESTVQFNQWTLVSAVFDHGRMGLFIQGIQVAFGTAPFSQICSEEYESDDLFIGDLWTDSYAPYSFDGKIDEVRISDTVRYLVTGIEGEQNIESQPVFVLCENFPNPFNEQTMIRFSIPQPSTVEVSVYNASGQRITTLIKACLSAGTHLIPWKAAGQNSGVYFVVLKSGAVVRSHKILYMK